MDGPHRPTRRRNNVLALQHLFCSAQRNRVFDSTMSTKGSGPGAGLRVSLIYFEPGGPLGILPAAFSKVTDTTKGPP
jgi:hypothetical protein